MSTTHPHASNLILGAGLAGLSLADALLRRGVRSPIVIADAREDFTNDRTWGFWDVHPHPYRKLVQQRWSEWSFRSGTTDHRQSSLMAHGAVDHNVPGRLLRRVLTRRERVLLIACYSGLSIVLMGLWWVAPLLALGLFLLIAIVHWGDGDLWFCEVINGRSAPRSFASLIFFVMARGLVPIAVPVLVDADASLSAFDGLLGLFGRDEALAISPTQRLVGLGVVGFVVVAAALLSVRDNRARPRRALLIDLGELGLLSVFFLLTPAVFAVGMYFLVWHSPRHILRLMSCEPRQQALLEKGRSLAALAAFHREALLFTVVPLIGVAAIAVALAATGAAQIAAVSLAVIASLTYPHAAIVAWMDYRQGVWHTSE